MTKTVYCQYMEIVVHQTGVSIIYILHIISRVVTKTVYCQNIEIVVHQTAVSFLYIYI